MFGTGGRFNFTGTMDKHPDIAYNKSDEIRLRMR